MDPVILVVAIAVLMPLATIWALVKSSRLRGPLDRPMSKRPVGPLVTDVLPEEHDDQADEEPPAGRSRTDLAQ